MDEVKNVKTLQTPTLVSQNIYCTCLLEVEGEHADSPQDIPALSVWIITTAAAEE